jgi:hypothetical protein
MDFSRFGIFTLGRDFDYFGHNKCVPKIKICSGGAF